MGSRYQNASKRAVAALLIGVLFVVGACGVEVAIAPAALTPTPVLIDPTAVPTTLLPASPTTATLTTTTTPITLAPPASAPVPWPGPNEVWLWGGEYRPNKITVPVGSTVTWKGKDADPHDVEGDTGLFFCSLPLGVSFNYTFAERGTFYYHCECNPGMVGVIIVD